MVLYVAASSPLAVVRGASAMHVYLGLWPSRKTRTSVDPQVWEVTVAGDGGGSAEDSYLMRTGCT